MTFFGGMLQISAIAGVGLEWDGDVIRTSAESPTSTGSSLATHKIDEEIFPADTAACENDRDALISDAGVVTVETLAYGDGVVRHAGPMLMQGDRHRMSQAVHGAIGEGLAALPRPFAIAEFKRPRL